MNFLELVKNRYSCRAYKSLDVEKEKLDYILECVRLAPSAVNKQPWRFHIVCKEEEKAWLQQCYDRDWFKTAPMYVIASVLRDEEWVRADGKHHGDIDIAIAVEHLCLAATEQGLATCWVCNFNAVQCKELFGLPENEEPAVLIPLGYAAERQRAGDGTSGTEMKPKNRKATEEIIK